MTTTSASLARPELPAIDLRGVRLHAITERECIAHVLGELRAGRGGHVVTPNLDHLVRSRRDPAFRELIQRADLSVADGMPLVWASRLQGTPLPERVAGSDLISTLSSAAAAEGRSVFLLGGNPGAAEGAAEILRGRSPELRIVGTHCPEFGFERDQQAMARLREAVSAADPDIVFVALGSPKQERVIVDLRPSLPHAWWLGVGISFSFLTGEVRRAPRWMQRIGLEFLHRLWQEPGRLARRYLVDGVPFALCLLAMACWRRLRRFAGTGGRRRGELS